MYLICKLGYDNGINANFGYLNAVKRFSIRNRSIATCNMRGKHAVTNENS